MQAPRHIGIGLHRNQFTCCVRVENGRNYLTEWKLEDLPRFVKKLRPADEIAVEVTGNTRLFYEAVAPCVARVVAVDPNQFQVISHSVKKTDPNDARNLALYLEKDLLPEPHVPERSSPSRVRFAAHQPRALDRSGPFRRLTEIRESGQLQSPLLAGSCLPLVGPELHDKFGVDKPS